MDECMDECIYHLHKKKVTEKSYKHLLKTSLLEVKDLKSLSNIIFLAF